MAKPFDHLDGLGKTRGEPVALYRLPPRGYRTAKHYLWFMQDQLSHLGKPRTAAEIAASYDDDPPIPVAEEPPSPLPVSPAPKLRGSFPSADTTPLHNAAGEGEGAHEPIVPVRAFPAGFEFADEPAVSAISSPAPAALADETLADARARQLLQNPEVAAAARLLFAAEGSAFEPGFRKALERLLKPAAAMPVVVAANKFTPADDGIARARSALDSGEAPAAKAYQQDGPTRITFTFDPAGASPGAITIARYSAAALLPAQPADFAATAPTADASELLFDEERSPAEPVAPVESGADVSLDDILGQINRLIDEAEGGPVSATPDDVLQLRFDQIEPPEIEGDPIGEAERDEDDARWDLFGEKAEDFALQGQQELQFPQIHELLALGMPAHMLPQVDEEPEAPKRKRGISIIRNAKAYLTRCGRRGRDMVRDFNDPLAKAIGNVNGAIVMAHARSLTGPVDAPAATPDTAPRRKRVRALLPSALRRRLRQTGAAFAQFESKTKAIRLAASLVMLSAATGSTPVAAPQLDPEQPTISDAGEARLIALSSDVRKDDALTRQHQFGLPIWQADLPANCGLPRFVSDFGPRADPFGHGTQIHYGVDVAPPLCDGEIMSGAVAGYVPIRAMQDGVVISYGTGGAAYGAMSGGRSYGHNVVVISRPDGDTTCAWREQDQGAIAVRYGHMSRPVTAEGDSPVCRWVNEGDIVGYWGGTGRSEAVHLDVRAGYVTLAQQGTAWVPTNIDYINLAAPGMIDTNAYDINRGLDLNTLEQTYTVAYGGPARRRAAPVVTDSPDVAIIESDIDGHDDDEIDGIESDIVVAGPLGAVGSQPALPSLVDIVPLDELPSAVVQIQTTEPILTASYVLPRPEDAAIVAMAAADTNEAEPTP